MKNPPQRLRDLTHLTVNRLAAIFGVSRQAYYKWLTGYFSHSSHYEHMLEVLPLIEETSQRLGLPNTVRIWLLTPTTPGGKKPIEYLTEREYNTFRGFLLQERTGQGRLIRRLDIL